MYIKGRDLFSPWLNDTKESLLCQVVRPYGTLGSHKENGFRGMKVRSLQKTLQTSKGTLGKVLGKCVDSNGSAATTCT